MTRFACLVLLLAAGACAEDVGPPLPESASASDLAEVQKRAQWLEIVHVGEACANYTASPAKCMEPSHWAYKMGEQTFSLTQPEAADPKDPRYQPLSKSYAEHMIQVGKSSEDSERKGLSTTEVVLYADHRTPAKIVVDGFVTTAMAGGVWKMYVACSTGLLPVFLPIDRGVMPSVSREGTALEVRVLVRLNPATHDPQFGVGDKPADSTGELEKQLTEAFAHLKERFPTVSFPLIVESTSEVPLQSLVDAITTGRKVGFQNVQLAVPGR